MNEVRAIAVIVPVHDEEELLARCLSAIEAARERVAMTVAVIVVLDACTDRSAEIAAVHAVQTVVIDARNVGRARAAGVAAASELFRELPPEQWWTAHTDADSVVPPNWLQHQLDLAHHGADVVVGTVRPDFADLTAPQRAAWLARHVPGVANGHVHGANLGMRADTLLTAGGFPPLAEHEDVALVDRARALGARVVASDAAGVHTSGRQHGRTPGGYARYLRDDLVTSGGSAPPDAA
ncbi:glycosyltransferase [Microbacterium sp. P04]|uniref:glycosyltransferase n=1 Tax=Microbacterium sp. P04 TaxID=3366947 RepID=UPI0037459180